MNQEIKTESLDFYYDRTYSGLRFIRKYNASYSPMFI